MAVAFSVILVLGTGSRMGGLAVIVGFIAFFRRRLDKLLLTACVIAAAVLAVYAAVGTEMAAGNSRVATLVDTRGAIWGVLLEQFLQAPVAGVNRENGNENSFLAIAAGFGLVGLFPLMLFLCSLFWQVWRAVRFRPLLGDYAVLADVVTASAFQFLVIWMFEGFLVGVLTDHLVLLYCLIGLTAVVNHRIHSAQMGLPSDGHASDPNGAEVASRDANGDVTVAA
jgi:O-antigen ligase